MEERINQILTLENRQRLSLTGVSKVDSFNDEIVVLITNKGNLTIKGKKLSISKLNVDEGKLVVNGCINSLIYSDKENQKEKEGFIKRLFK